jgi:hypothetical protein
MKITALAIIAIVTAMVLITASTLASTALAISGSTSKKKKDSYIQAAPRAQVALQKAPKALAPQVAAPAAQQAAKITY